MSSPPSEPDNRLLGFLKARYLGVDLHWLGVFRIAFGLILLSELLARWAQARVFFSNDGVLPNHYSIFNPLSGDLFSIYHAASTLPEVHVFFTFTFVVFLAFTVGFWTKLSHFLSWVLIVSLHSRNLMMENGGSVVLHVVGLWTLFLPLGARLSVDSLLTSLGEELETDAQALNAPRAEGRTEVHRLATLALALQWSAIYFFNAVQKSGKGWMEGSAIHYFLHQDRIVTSLGVWVREHAPASALAAATYGTLVVEGLLALLLLVPFRQRSFRLAALALGWALHGGIAALSRLGPFSYIMGAVFLVFLSSEDWRAVVRWMWAPRRRAITVVYDNDCGICLLFARVLRRLDLGGVVTFIGNDEPVVERFGLPKERFEATLVVQDAQGRLYQEAAAVTRALGAVPGLALPTRLMRLPGVSTVLDWMYRQVASRRQTISAFFGLGVCGVGRAGGAAPRAGVPVAPWRSWLAGWRQELGNAVVAVLMFVVAWEVMVANEFIRTRFKTHLPKPLQTIVRRARIFQGWSMFAPEPPYDDGRLVVDGRTVDGRKWDPLAGEVPDFDSAHARGWGQSELWCDYHLGVANQGRDYHQWLGRYLQRVHEFTGNPNDRLVAFDIYWVNDQSPKPGAGSFGTQDPPRLLWSFAKVEETNEAMRAATSSP